MKKIVFLFTLASYTASQAQEVLNMPPTFLPNRADSNNFYISFSASYIFPQSGKNDFQKSRLGNKKNRSQLFKGEMEMLGFLTGKRDHLFVPHAFLRLEAYPMHYLSSKFGVGVSYRPWNASVGFFTGTYYRHVPYESNFITRRRKSFENYPLNGGYAQISQNDFSFFVSLAQEKRKTFVATRLAGRMGRTLGLGGKNSQLRTIEMVASYESFSGFGTGFSVEALPHTRVEVLLINPAEEDRNDQARLGRMLSSRGCLVSIGYWLN